MHSDILSGDKTGQNGLHLTRGSKNDFIGIGFGVGSLILFHPLTNSNEICLANTQDYIRRFSLHRLLVLSLTKTQHQQKNCFPAYIPHEVKIV